MTVTYTTSSKIGTFLHITISSETTPTTTEVESRINRAEDNIDWTTGHAWRLRYSGTQSGEDTTARYEYYDVDFNYKYYTGIPVYLKHRLIRALSSASGDVMELWDGSSWTNWLTTKTEGRGNDYWLDYERGILFFKGGFSIRKPMSLRIKYRYGDTSVPKMIEDIATKMVAIDILTTESRAVIIQEGSSALSYQQRVDRWNTEIENNLTSLKEFQVPAIHM